MMDLQDSLDHYRTDQGSYPVSDEHGTWIEKLLESGYLHESRFGTRIMGDQIRAVAWGAYVYTPPEDRTTPVVDAEQRPLLHWTGKNAIDEGGRGDDVILFRSVNSGYYWKKRWPWVRPVFGVFVVAFVPALLLLRRWWKLDAARIVTVTVGYWAVAYIVIRPLMYTPFRIGATTANPGAGDWVLAWVVLFAIGLFELTRYQHGRERARGGRCPSCGYDLRGLAGGRCPECGRDATMDAERDGRRG
jgi:hypothetical protein